MLPRRIGLGAPLALLAVQLAAARFSPAPARPLHTYATEPQEASAPGVKKFRHSFESRMSTGAMYAVQWEVDADPATILSLDVEHQNGARILDCRRNSLRLLLRSTHSQQISSLQHIVASKDFHDCPHIDDGDHLYHRVESVKSVTQASEGRLAIEFATQPLEDATHIFPSMSVQLQFVPKFLMDRFDVSVADRARRLQEDGANTASWAGGSVNSYASPYQEAAQSSNIGASGSLQAGSNASSAASAFVNAINGQMSTGNTQMSNQVQPTIADNQVDLLKDLSPKTIENIGWNWDYNANTTRNPEFVVQYPGGNSWLRLHQPYLKAHFGVVMNFSSVFPDITSTPQVSMKAEVKGMADMNIDLATEARFTDQGTKVSSSTLLHNIHFPFLGQEKEWMKAFDVDIGGVPVKVQPGFTCHLNAWHVGELEGSLRLALKTLLIVDGMITYDSDAGMQSNFTATARNVNFTPPTWMLFTKHFELGVEMVPELWMKGGLGPINGMEFGVGLRPFFNVSIMQKGQSAIGGLEDVGEINELIVMPTRVSGLTDGQPFCVKISTNGLSRKSSTQIPLHGGTVTFTDMIDDFNFGSVDRLALTSSNISVEILGSCRDSDVVSTGTIVCLSLMDGSCYPDPMTVKMTKPVGAAGAPTVFLSTAWHDSPVAYLLQKVRGIAFRAPVIDVVRPFAEEWFQQHKIDEMTASYQLLVTRDGKTYTIPFQINETSSDESLLKLKSAYQEELGQQYLDDWAENEEGGTECSKYGTSGSCPASACVWDTQCVAKKAIRLDLQISDQTVGNAVMPPVRWNEGDWFSPQTTSLLDSDSMFASSDPSGLGWGDAVVVALKEPSGQHQINADASIQVQVTDTALSTYWIFPYEATQFREGDEKVTLAWTVTMQYNWYQATIKGQLSFKISLLESSGNSLTPTSWSQELQDLKCTSDQDEVEVHTYTDAVVPCVFEYDFEVPSGLVSAADKVVVFLIEWDDHWGRQHSMESVPVQIMGSSRRLLELMVPSDGDVISIGNANRHLDIAWSRRLRDTEAKDRHHMQKKAPLLRPKVKHLELPQSVDLSVSRVGDGSTVYSRVEHPTRDWWAHVPHRELANWPEGDYIVNLRWQDHHGKQEETKGFRICGSCAERKGDMTVKAERRRLQENSIHFGTAPSNHGLAWGNEEDRTHMSNSDLWKARTETIDCDAKPLEYDFGFGVTLKNDLKNVLIPNDVPLLGGHSMAPDWSSPATVLIQDEEGDSLEHLFPAGVCAGGACAGEMPGCKPDPVNPINIKQIVFKLSRVFKLEDFLGASDNEENVKRAIAYGLALLPEAIEVWAEEEEPCDNFDSMMDCPGRCHWDGNVCYKKGSPPTTSTMRPTTMTTTTTTMTLATTTLPTTTALPTIPTTTTLPTLPPLATASSTLATTSATIPAAATAAVAVTAAATGTTANMVTAAAVPTIPHDFLEGQTTATTTMAPGMFMSQTTTDVVNLSQTTTNVANPRRLSHLVGRESDHLVVKVVRPMLFTFDEKKIQRLIDVGAFDLLSDKREKTHGRVSIVGFELRAPETQPQEAQDDVAQELVSLPGSALLLFIGMVAMATVTVGFAVRMAKRRGYEVVETAEESARELP